MTAAHLVVRTNAALQDAINMRKAVFGYKIGLVPTMGALHEGHAELIRTAAKRNEFVVVSIFVNPMQFGPNEDFAKYPRSFEADCELAAANGANLIFAPSVEEMYAPNFMTFVEVTGMDQTLCGASRPGHFRGVCTVVLKLFNLTAPEFAVFGGKDAQQVRIIRRMIADLNLPIELVVVPTIREPDGLAMSSRNSYLSPAERAVAPRIYQALELIRNRSSSEKDAAKLESELASELSAIPGARLDYAKIVDESTLAAIDRLDRPALVAVAVYLGGTPD